MSQSSDKPENKDLPLRSYLAVPGNRYDMLEKAAASPADAVFIDLEDSVPEEDKTTAIANAGTALDNIDWQLKHVAVRLNSFDSGRLDQEVSVLAKKDRLDAVILPKAECTDSINYLASAINHNRPHTLGTLAIELLIESARGIMLVDSLAGAHPDISALHLGVADFAASIGARSAAIGESPPGYAHLSDGKRYPLDLFAYPMMRVLIAARAFNLQAIDGPLGNYTDSEACYVSAQRAASMGFDGKQVIHPAQIEPTRQAFIPTDEEITHARRVQKAIDEARCSDQGATTLDGKMIDEASLRMIRRVLKHAE